jgi:hypothetical protein
VGGDVIERHAGRGLAHRLDVAAGDDADEVPVALLAGGEQHQVIDGVVPVTGPVAVAAGPGHVHLAAEDGLDLLLLAGLVELDRAEHVAMIGEGHGAHPLGLGARHQVLDLERAIEQRVLRVDVEVDELGSHGGRTSPCHTALTRRRKGERAPAPTAPEIRAEPGGAADRRPSRAWSSGKGRRPHWRRGGAPASRGARSFGHRAGHHAAPRFGGAGLAVYRTVRIRSRGHERLPILMSLGPPCLNSRK